MIKLIIKSKDEYSNYVLKDNKNNIYEVNINFIDVELPPVEASIYIPEKVLKEKVSLNYGLIEDTANINEDELITIIQNDKKLYLQRFYG